MISVLRSELKKRINYSETCVLRICASTFMPTGTYSSTEPITVKRKQTKLDQVMTLTGGLLRLLLNPPVPSLPLTPPSPPGLLLPGCTPPLVCPPGDPISCCLPTFYIVFSSPLSHPSQSSYSLGNWFVHIPFSQSCKVLNTPGVGISPRLPLVGRHLLLTFYTPQG